MTINKDGVGTGGSGKGTGSNPRVDLATARKKKQRLIIAGVIAIFLVIGFFTKG